MDEKIVPNPFEAAKRVAGLTVRLQPHDLIEASPSLTEVQARQVLDQHGSSIAVQMITAGIEAALTILRQEGVAS